MKKITFAEHKETTARDCEQVAKMLTELANKVREGDLKSFEQWWVENGTEEGDAKMFAVRENIVLRYVVRGENIE